uniref:Zinc finger protein 804B n=1 Tax=Pogona vitticeps TaxID=103695 RepID=A0A6J0T1F3_9SAUR
MACYLVISSRHLSNGHYRGIKGIFRGPLCKNGSASPDFAEKEKAAARALEDVKSNFYCELCDKQYHKHHEFDNHINSYDHAHKQRLKELKQREFARNVASKSWKDEKKQEKALKRLHQLAELRKQSECVTGCKKPQVTVEKEQQPQENLLLGQERKAKNEAEKQNLTSSTSEKQQELLLSKSQSCVERRHLLRDRIPPSFSCGTNNCNRAGVSFSFAKKVHLKLESSASVFSENMEEAYDCLGSPRRKAKERSEKCQGCIHMSDERKANVQKQLNTLQGHSEIVVSCNLAGKNKTQKENDPSINKAEVEMHLSSCKNNIHPSDLECTASPGVRKQGRVSWDENQKSLETLVAPPCHTQTVCMQQNAYKHNDAPLAEYVSDRLLSTQDSSKQGHPCEFNYSPFVFKQSPNCSKTVNTNAETPRGNAVVHEIKPKSLPFLQVLSKDGTTALRWPTELLLFTKTEPSISYGCNPLYFDFRLSLSHRDSGHHEVNTEREHPDTMDIDGNEASGLSEIQQPSSGKDNRSLKPKKIRALSLKQPQPKLDLDTENEMHQSAPKYISDDLNENVPQVPACLDCSQRHHATAIRPCPTMHVRSLAQHLQTCEKTLQDEVTENICIYPLVSSRTNMQKCAQCDLIYSPTRTNLDLVTCTEDLSDGGKDSILSYNLGPNGGFVANTDNRSLDGCWKFSSLQNPLSDRQSNYSDTSASSATSFATCYSSHRSSDHSRSRLSFCCKRKQKPVERQKCKHKKHNCVSSSDDADEDCLFHEKSQKSRNCTQSHTVKYQRHPRYRYLLQRDISKPGRNRHLLCKHSRGRSYSSSKSSSTQDSGSSERSSSCTRSRGSSSGSLAKESTYSWNKCKKDDSTKPGTSESARSDCQYVTFPSKRTGMCSFNRLEREAVGKKSLTAKLLLEKVNSKRNQAQTQNTELFSNPYGVDIPHSQTDIKCLSSVGNEAMFSSPERALHHDTNRVWNNEPTALQSNAGKDQVDITAIDNLTFPASTNYGDRLLKDITQRGPGYQSPYVEKDTAITEQSSLLPGEMQSLLHSCDPVPNDFPGAFSSHRYSVVPNLTETKEEHNTSMNLKGLEGHLNCPSDSTMHKSSETENKTELYSKCISSPLTQQPITFSPDEIDKYRFLQLQAQQHMQKQLVAKHLKVLPATGQAAFPASPVVQPIPVHQHSAVATLHHTLLQSFAFSAGVHPHSSHLSLTHIHPFAQSHFAPMSFSPFAPTFMPSHSALLTGHPFRLVSATPIHPSHLAIPPLPHTAFIPTLFTPQLNAAAASAIHLNPFIHPLFQSQELQHRS